MKNTILEIIANTSKKIIEWTGDRISEFRPFVKLCIPYVHSIELVCAVLVIAAYIVFECVRPIHVMIALAVIVVGSLG